MSSWTATGRTRHTARRSWGRESLVLKVEERGIHTYCVAGHIDSEWSTRWRDAITADLTATQSPTDPAQGEHHG